MTRGHEIQLDGVGRRDQVCRNNINIKRDENCVSKINPVLGKEVKDVGKEENACVEASNEKSFSASPAPPRIAF